MPISMPHPKAACCRASRSTAAGSSPTVATSRSSMVAAWPIPRPALTCHSWFMTHRWIKSCRHLEASSVEQLLMSLKDASHHLQTVEIKWIRESHPMLMRWPLSYRANGRICLVDQVPCRLKIISTALRSAGSLSLWLIASRSQTIRMIGKSMRDTWWVSLMCRLHHLKLKKSKFRVLRKKVKRWVTLKTTCPSRCQDRSCTGTTRRLMRNCRRWSVKSLKGGVRGDQDEVSLSLSGRAWLAKTTRLREALNRIRRSVKRIVVRFHTYGAR